MWPFTARVNEKTAPIERIAAVAICRRLRDARGRIYAPPSMANALLAGIAAETAQIATAFGPTVHVSFGSSSAVVLDRPARQLTPR
jgi:hypothetical protein